MGRSWNEKEMVESIFEELKSEGHDVTKTMIDRVMDKSTDLAIGALGRGENIKFRGLGSFQVKTHAERKFKTPQGVEGVAPAGVHVLFNESDSLLKVMNA